MNKQYTCGSCPNMRVGGTPRMPIPHCVSTDQIVPHEYDGINFRFWRIPTSCPLSNDNLVKSEEMAAEKHHVIKTKSEVQWA